MRAPSFLLSALLVASACSSQPGITSNVDKNGSGSNGSGTGSNGSGTGSNGSGSGSAGKSGSGTGSGGSGGTFFTVRDAGGSADAPSASAADGNNCGLQKYMLERVPPELLLVFDRSSSMNMKDVPMSMNSRWTETRAGLDQVLMATDATVRWGLKVFPSGMQCGVTMGADVAVNDKTSMPIINFLNMGTSQPGAAPASSGTPTAAAINGAVTYLKTVTTKNPKYILLATDGEPDCGGDAVPSAITAITQAKAAGFPSFVVGIATSGTKGDTTLNMMANAGGQARAGATTYYPVSNKDDLVKALSMIAAQVSSCVFPLDKQPPSPMDVAVNLDGKRIMHDATTGWEYGSGMKSIEIKGPACDDLKAGKIMDVQIIFGCPFMPIP
jgi:hypothetical protein